MIKVAAIASAVAVAPLILIAPLTVALIGSSNAQAACGDQQGVDAAAVVGQVESVLKGSSSDSVSVPGLDDPKEQIPNAKAIQATGVAMRVPVRGQIVALATALQESGLRNLDHGDRDSLGLFQQRPSQGWGTPEQVRDPVYASTKFYEGLLEVSGWESMPVTQAAQAVQASGFPDAYAKWEPLATALQKAISATLPQAGVDTSPAGATPVPTALGGRCADGTSFGPIPPGSLPDGYQIPADAPKPVQTAIRWGLVQLGTPYQWGGACTEPRGPDPMGRCDCSSLMQMSFKAGGVSLTRTTYTQVNEGRVVSVDTLQPGDLLFTRGTAAVPEHVGMFIGSGLILHAPRTGDVVKISTLADWKPDVLAARRVV
ncbi:C40 family peptidase [Streptomyces sp. NBC_00162]|uniref:C40 family peptidase n=1 Tax=Streptomyces sp. NBC_00162 TaxID=2903629 RepID=UPI00214B4E69|nr:C40 family peptidase [Streptomyces sp. NBC_00162]UUU38728.1 C40 family peptidase [Streptomyces sp. NBC_00162]